MKLFIDSADIDEIKEAKSYGILDGVTTNPSLIKKAVDKRKKSKKKIDMESYIEAILEICKGLPVSLEVIGNTYEDMIREGELLYEKFNPIAKNVYIKIPVNPAFKDGDKTHFDGIAAIRALAREKIPVNCTLIFTPEQALLVAKAGAKFVSPFAGRIDDLIRKRAGMKFDKTDYFPMGGMGKKGKILEDNGVVSGIDLVSQCVQILKRHGLKTEVLAASLRNPRHVREAALVGADIGTLPFSVVKDMLKHEETYEGMKKFTEDIVEDYVKLSVK